MTNKIFIVNPRLTYVSTQLLLEWIIGKSDSLLYVSYYNLIEKIDEFLMEQVEFDDTIFLIGFNIEKSNEIKNIFKKYKFKIFHSEINNNSIFKTVMSKNITNIKNKLNPKQLLYIKIIYNLLNDNYNIKESYLINILFYQVKPKIFYNLFKCGVVDFSKYNYLIKKHIMEFKKENHQVFKYEDFYFINSSIKFLADFIYKYHDKYDNISLIDLTTQRVYFKNLNNKNIDINKLCMNYCEDYRGFKDFCSGSITPKFLELTKTMKPINNE